MSEPNTFREVVKQAYKFSEWAKKIKGAASGPLSHNFVPRSEAFDEFNFEMRRALPNQRNAYIDYYRSKKIEGVRVALTIVEYASVQDAHEGLVDILETCMAPSLPRAEERGINVGDHAFAGLGEMQTSIFFVRGNVVVKVESAGTAPYSVASFAEQVDRQLMAGRDTKK